MNRALPALAALLLAAPAVAHARPRGPAPKGAAVTLAHGDARVGTYVSSADGFRTSSYWIEGPDGLVVIDTQFIPSGAAELIDWAEATTGKKVKLAVVLHANPDKFNGTATFQKRGIKVVTSKQVAALIPAVHTLRKRWFYDRWKPDYPADEPKPDTFGDATTTLKVAGIELKLHVLGAGCSESHVVAEFDGHLFVGDLVANGGHAWLELGRTPDWLARLSELEGLEPTFVHPGRGPTGGPELLVRQRHYLERVVAHVAAAKPKLPISDEELARLQAEIEGEFPGLGYAKFLELGLPAEYARQAHALEPTAPAAPAAKP